MTDVRRVVYFLHAVRAPLLRALPHFALVPLVAGLALAPLAASAQSAQQYPDKPIRFIVPFTAGGTTDLLARIISSKMSENWGQPVVIENRTGAGGQIANHLVSKAAGDGYTLLLTSPAFVITAALQTSLTYDPLKDFVGVAQIGYNTQALLVSPALGVKTAKEFIAYAQARPGKILFASAGAGSTTHMLGEMFRYAAGLKVVHVAFKGGVDAIIEVAAERVHYALVGLTGSMAFIKDGKLLALAVTTPKRVSVLPDVPTLSEVLPGWEREGSNSLLAPAGTPGAIRAKISKEIARILHLPDVAEKLEAVGYQLAPTTPEEHDRILRAQIEILSKVVRATGMRPK
jgi:tripartite-type tricarboxylate transporter receptor subunit TctC